MNTYSNRWNSAMEQLNKQLKAQHVSLERQREAQQAAQQAHYEKMRHQADHDDTLPILQQRIIQLESQVSVLMSTCEQLFKMFTGTGVQYAVYDNSFTRDNDEN